jgi:hypothetical protein
MLGFYCIAIAVVDAYGICWLERRFESIFLSAGPRLDINSFGLIGAVCGGTEDVSEPCKLPVPFF